MLRKALLLCGIVSSLLYAAMMVLIARQWPGYSSASQVVSELSAVGAPTRSLWILPGAVHLALSAVTVVLMLFAIAFGAAALGTRFRVYSIATLGILLAFGMLTFIDAPRVGANAPTPWIGVWERINIGAFLLWMVVFSATLWERKAFGAATVYEAAAAPHVGGSVDDRFETVRDAFAENFVRRRELGGACCAYHRGEKVVDLWGGVRNKQTGEPWETDTMVVVHSARQKPAWEPGTRQAYHALTLGFYENELLRRVDPHHRSIGRFFQEEIASPLGLDLYLGLPDTIPNSRLATIAPPGAIDMLRGFPIRFAIEASTNA